MQFINYILDENHIYNKLECPGDCEFKPKYKVPIVGVIPPQPDKLLGIIISRDPTTAFKKPYLKARRKGEAGWRNELMAADAPPQWLISKIKKFDELNMNGKHSNDMNLIEKTIADNVYWTHLHKCCTDKNDRELCAVHFKHKNAKLCANTWLINEIKEARESGLKFIICLGKDVEAFIEPRENILMESKIKILYFPHPARTANGAWYTKDPDKKARLMKNIDDLFLACKN